MIDLANRLNTNVELEKMRLLGWLGLVDHKSNDKDRIIKKQYFILLLRKIAKSRKIDLVLLIITIFFYLKTLPNCRTSEATPSKTEPVPLRAPLTVPHAESIRLIINIIIDWVFILNSQYINILVYNYYITYKRLHQIISIQAFDLY